MPNGNTLFISTISYDLGSLRVGLTLIGIYKLTDAAQILFLFKKMKLRRIFYLHSEILSSKSKGWVKMRKDVHSGSKDII